MIKFNFVNQLNFFNNYGGMQFRKKIITVLANNVFAMSIAEILERRNCVTGSVTSSGELSSNWEFLTHLGINLGILPFLGKSGNYREYVLYLSGIIRESE